MTHIPEHFQKLFERAEEVKKELRRRIAETEKAIIPELDKENHGDDKIQL